MNLPTGLKVHCASCNVVIPSDAPLPAAGANCAWVAKNKMGPWHANETIKGQHTAATAAWMLIHHQALNGPTPDVASVAYAKQYRKDPKGHFVNSAVRKAMTPADLQAQQTHQKWHRDVHFYS